MAVRGIRGAITVNDDQPREILEATSELLGEIIAQNELDSEDIVSIIFTVTPDIKSTFPAQAARAMGLHLVPLLGSQEIGVKGAIARCIRVLLHVNTNKTQAEIYHCFMRDASKLREDLNRAID